MQLSCYFGMVYWSFWLKSHLSYNLPLNGLMVIILILLLTLHL